MTTMTNYVPTWERNYDRWETEPDFWDLTDEPEETEDLLIEDVSEDDLLAEFDEDLETEDDFE